MRNKTNIAQFTPQSISNVAISGFVSAQPDGAAIKVSGEVSIPRFERNLPRLLWIGDAMVPTGFAKVTHSIVDRLCSDWNILVSGVNCTEPHSNLPYPVIPAQQKGDMWGIDSFADLCAEFDPDLVVINNDWWNVAKFLRCEVDVPIVAYMPVDGANLNPRDIATLNQLEAAVWYTDFGWSEALAAGYKGTRHVVPHGTEQTDSAMVSKADARQTLGMDIPANAFLVGNVNRNQPRKRIDLTVDYFASWIHEQNVDDAWLCLHCSHSDDGWDLLRLAEYYGIADRIVFTDGDGAIGSVSEDELDLIYRSLDVQVTTTSGEGWGLTTMEGMSRGIPQIVPDWAALGEWALSGVERIPCSHTCAHPVINTIGAVPDREPFIEALDKLYRNPLLRKSAGSAGKSLVSRDHYSWQAVASQFNRILQSTMAPAITTNPLRRAS